MLPAVIVVPVISQAVIVPKSALIADSSLTSSLSASIEPAIISLDVIVLAAISFAVISPVAILLATIVLAAIFAHVVNELWSPHPKA